MRLYSTGCVILQDLTAGVLIRHTIPAMALTLAIFAAVQVVMPIVVRPHLIAPGLYKAAAAHGEPA